MLLRSSKIRADDFFTLLGFGTWISQVDGVGTGTGTDNGFSPCSKPRGIIIFILF